MLNSILAVTIFVDDLNGFESAYRVFLNYETIDRGLVSSNLATLWSAPHITGSPYVLMGPESRAPVYIRAVQSRNIRRGIPHPPLGWGAIEILARSPDELATKLFGSPFQLIGSPRNLSSHETIRSMQVRGPADEALYFTSIPADGAELQLLPAITEVDRVFVVVAGVSDLESARIYYYANFNQASSAPFDLRISSLSRAYGLDPETLHPISFMSLRESTLIELNQYPPEAKSCDLAIGEFPSGLAIVSFTTNTLGEFNRQAVPIKEKPYEGRKVAITRGIEGELIELVG